MSVPVAIPDIDLICHESMPAPSHLPTFSPLSQLRPHLLPIHDDGLCFCLDQCGYPCKARPLRSHKRKRSPSPRQYQFGDDTWVQTIKLFHPTDFEYTTVEMDCDRPFKAIFRELCSDHRLDRKQVAFVWNRKRRNGGVQLVKLSDDSVPWDIGMREGVDETIECDFV